MLAGPFFPIKETRAEGRPGQGGRPTVRALAAPGSSAPIQKTCLSSDSSYERGDSASQKQSPLALTESRSAAIYGRLKQRRSRARALIVLSAPLLQPALGNSCCGVIGQRRLRRWPWAPVTSSSACSAVIRDSVRVVQIHAFMRGAHVHRCARTAHFSANLFYYEYCVFSTNGCLFD